MIQRHMAGLSAACQSATAVAAAVKTRNHAQQSGPIPQISLGLRCGRRGACGLAAGERFARAQGNRGSIRGGDKKVPRMRECHLLRTSYIGIWAGEGVARCFPRRLARPGACMVLRRALAEEACASHTEGCRAAAPRHSPPLGHACAHGAMSPAPSPATPPSTSAVARRHVETAVLVPKASAERWGGAEDLKGGTAREWRGTLAESAGGRRQSDSRPLPSSAHTPAAWPSAPSLLPQQRLRGRMYLFKRPGKRWREAGRTADSPRSRDELGGRTCTRAKRIDDTASGESVI